VKNEPKWFAMSEQIEGMVKARKSIDVNVDFYSASAYYYMGIEPYLFTPIFAVSRISGWVAHVLEQYANNRLIRPRSHWVGAADREYVAIERRA
jgi:citrate synthase